MVFFLIFRRTEFLAASQIFGTFVGQNFFRYKVIPTMFLMISLSSLSSPPANEPEQTGEPESINEIPLPTPPTDDDMNRQPPRIVGQLPKIVGRKKLMLLRVIKVPKLVPTSPVGPLEHCMPNPCRNNGSCMAGHPERPYHCKCPLGYSGRHCTG